MPATEHSGQPRRARTVALTVPGEGKPLAAKGPPRGHARGPLGSRTHEALLEAQRTFLASVWKPVVMLLGATLFGTLGYVAIEGWPPSDALYMTVITLVT